ncbi:hypothetical protein ACJIZ3_013382 [Penstemon smallii]|uniref:TCP domain-containing protein n=1 Tax=Penstemon smallii TaxID=265156 RepID=A0ABD3UT76_9LAMI
MEVNEIQCKFPRMSNGNGRSDSTKMDGQYPDDEEEGEHKRDGGTAKINAAFGGGVGKFYGWPSSRIVRVSRASGGKDRHSKVLTSKGLRDRRVRLSVNTAIQFYDLQDRLGFDQPSKAVEWLLKAAATSIEELPPMNAPFLDTSPKQLSDEKMSSTGGGSDQLGLDSVDMDPSYPNHQQQTQHATKTKSSACSSNSENSKGSGLSLSRSENRVKARVRAKGRVAEKEKENESSSIVASLNPVSHATSFTELLNSNGGGNISSRQWSSAPMEYFTTGQTHLAANPLFSVSGDSHFSFVPNNLVSVESNGNTSNNHHHNNSSEYNLNFTISSSGNSSGLSGFNRGTLQSNSSSPSLLPHLQRFPPVDGSPQSFFINTAAPPTENHHQFLSGFDGRLHFSYGESGHRGGKGKN